MPKRLTQEEYLERLEKIYKNDNYDFSKVEYKNAEGKIIVTCPVHGEFKQRAATLIKANGKNSACPKCSYDKLRHNKNDILKKIKKIHGDKYIYNNLNYTQ